MTALKKTSSAKAKTPKKSCSTNQIRIIGGQHRRRLISFIDADGLRPTPDRLRETIFNWLTGHITDARVLDACAAPGGKTAHLLEKFDIKQMVALDSDAERLKRVEENLSRLQLLDHRVVTQATNAATWQAEQPLLPRQPASPHCRRRASTAPA